MAVSYLLEQSDCALKPLDYHIGLESYSLSSIGLRMTSEGLYPNGWVRVASKVIEKIDNIVSGDISIVRGKNFKVWKQDKFSLVFASGCGKVSVVALPQIEHTQKFLKVQSELRAAGPASVLPGSVGTIEGRIKGATDFQLDRRHAKSIKRVVEISSIQSHFKLGDSFKDSDIQEWIPWRLEALSLLLDDSKRNNFSLFFSNENENLWRQLYRDNLPTTFLRRVAKLAEYFEFTPKFFDQGIVLCHGSLDRKKFGLAYFFPKDWIPQGSN